MTQQSASDDSATRKKAAEWSVTNFLRGYPDFGKAAPAYVASLMDVVERYPVEVIKRLADPQTGVSARYRDFLPTSGQVVALADEITQRLATRPREQRVVLSMDDYGVLRRAGLVDEWTKAAPDQRSVIFARAKAKLG